MRHASENSTRPSSSTHTPPPPGGHNPAAMSVSNNVVREISTTYLGKKCVSGVPQGPILTAPHFTSHSYSFCIAHSPPDHCKPRHRAQACPGVPTNTPLSSFSLSPSPPPLSLSLVHSTRLLHLSGASFSSSRHCTSSQPSRLRT
ncbi:hypothetical protein E2C01_085094 [Portunus trituberculatus]|uniref:Uncharacterized protein n=1 Tax=Portunus trituberculatus TaxID=210409 RepID=A0A5B7JCM3_PORTR|nr:hypothetical protein [Portunus trituberculatus]